MPHPAFRQLESLLWEKLEEGEPTGKLYREINTKPSEWVGDDASEEEKKAWSTEAERRMELADAPGVEMFFAIGNGPIPDITFVEPVPEEE